MKCNLDIIFAITGIVFIIRGHVDKLKHAWQTEWKRSIYQGMGCWVCVDLRAYLSVRYRGERGSRQEGEGRGGKREKEVGWGVSRSLSPGQSASPCQSAFPAARRRTETTGVLRSACSCRRVGDSHAGGSREAAIRTGRWSSGAKEKTAQPETDWGTEVSPLRFLLNWSEEEKAEDCRADWYGFPRLFFHRFLFN